MNREQTAASIGAALGSLRDVAGVHGSFVLSQTGELIGKDLPAVFDDHVFAEVGPRVVRLRDTFASVGDDMEGCLLRFAEHKLFLRAMNEGTVGVLLTLSANMPALKMAVSLAVRRMAPEVTAFHRLPRETPLQSLAPSPLTPSVTPPPPTSSSSPSTVRPRGKVVFRGQEVK